MRLWVAPLLFALGVCFFLIVIYSTTTPVIALCALFGLGIMFVLLVHAVAWDVDRYEKKRKSGG